MSIEIAKVCHEANRALCLAFGDDSQPAWEDAPEWQRDSAKDGVKFHMQNPDSTPEGSHDNWSEVKVEAGWVYGEEKDEALKTHPCLVPYDELPAEQRAKDHIFVAIVRALT